MAKKSKTFLGWIFYSLGCSCAGATLFLGLAGNFSSVFTPVVSFEVPGVVKPDSEIRVYFSQPIKMETVNQSFRITPEVEGDLVWDSDKKGFTFTPAETMRPGQKYVLAFSGQNNFWLPFEAEKEIKIETAPEIIEAHPFQGQGVAADAKIFVKFNRPVGNYYLDFKIKPETPFTLDYTESKDEFVLVPKEELLNDQNYEVEVHQTYKGRKGEKDFEAVKTFSFSTLAPLELTVSSPLNGKRDISLSQLVTMGFNKEVDLESFREHLEVTPEMLYTLKPSANGKTIVLDPEILTEDTDYKIFLKQGLRATDGSYLEEDQVIYFKTGNKGGVVKDERQATDAPHITDGKYIDVNLKTQLMDIYTDGVLLGTYMVSSGKNGMQTPAGEFSVMRKERRHWSNQYKLWMPFSMQFTSAGHFIHELPEWPNGYKEGVNHLGIPVSHGCIRLGVGPAEIVFNFADVGTKIWVHY